MKGGKIMKLDLNKFYNTNYKDFVHKEAVEEALRMVAEIDLKDVEIDTILSITFSVDEFGENPLYVEYLDKESKKHIVRIRPAVTNEIQEMLKRYVTLEQHEKDKQDIYNHFEHIHVPMEIRSEKAFDEEGNKVITLNNNNTNISFHVDPETDNEIQWLCIDNKGGLGSQSMYFARFMDYAKLDQVPSNDEFLEKIQQLEELIQRKSQETLQSSKEYTDTQDNVLRTEITTNVTNQINETKNDILSYVDVKVDELKDYVDNLDAEYHEVAQQYADNAKQEAVNSSKRYTDAKTSETLDLSKKYTYTNHTEVIQHLNELRDDMNTNFKTLNERISNKATVYKRNMSQSERYYIPQITVTTKTDGDIILEGKDETTVKLANLLNDEQLATLKNLPKFEQFVTLENLASLIGNSQPIEMSVSYDGNDLELNNYSSYATIGNTTIVNINCNFNAPFKSWTAPVLNALNITSETLKSFPTFMMDCIVKTATNVSSYTTTTTFSNMISTLYVETPVIKPNETIARSLISFNGSYIFNNTKEAENDE